VTVFLCVSVFLCAVLLMGQVPELKWIGLDWIGYRRPGGCIPVVMVVHIVDTANKYSRSYFLFYFVNLTFVLCCFFDSTTGYSYLKDICINH